MFTKKLLAAVGLAGALVLGATADASANPWRGSYVRPVGGYRPVVRAPLYAPVYRAPVVYGAAYAPVYQGPVYAPIYQAPVYAPAYQTPVYAPAYPASIYVPAYRPVGWRHPAWGHVAGRRW